MSDQATTVLRLARVTYVHPESHMMDVIYLDTGDFGRNVQLMSPMAGSDFGTSGMAFPDEEGHEPNMRNEGRVITAVVASINGINVCLGFLFPQVSQMAFPKEGHKNRMVTRYPSDVVTTFDGDGNAFILLPSGGCYAGFGPDSGSPPALEGQDFDGLYAISRNTSGSPSMTVRCSYDGGGGSVSLSHGGLAMTHALSTTMTSKTMSVSASESFGIESPAVTVKGANSMELSAPTTVIKGNVEIEGALILKGGSMTGGGGALRIEATSISMEGNTIGLVAPGGLVEDAPTVHTTGVHTDSRGGHG